MNSGTSDRVIQWMPDFYGVSVPLETCAAAALYNGFPGFAIQAGGLCFGSASMFSGAASEMYNTYNSLGTSQSCFNGDITLL